MVDQKITRMLLEFLSDLPVSLVHTCADAIGNAESSAEARLRIADIVIRADKRSQISTLIEECRNVRELEWLAVALETMASQTISHDHGSIRLLWTGRDTVEEARSLDQALLEVIKSARHHLWILSYVSYGADLAIKAMRERIDKGVNIKMVLEPSITSGGTLSHDSSEILVQQIPGIALYWWPTERRPEVDGTHGTLHAKGAVADIDLAVISSANLTGRAMDANLELGVLFRGGDIPKNLRNQLDKMVERGVFVPFPNHLS